MRCPKCGAFMEEGKDTCFMCGTNIKTYVPENNNPNNMQNQNMNRQFGSGATFQTGGFSNGNNFNPNYNQQKANYISQQKDYHNVELKPVKNGEKDIFDFLQEHKKMIQIGLGVLLLAILLFAANRYYKYKSAEPNVEPVLKNLYYEVDDSLEKVGEGKQGEVIYNKSGSKGTECSIQIKIGSSTSDNHVKEWFLKEKLMLEPKLDHTGRVINDQEIYVSQQGEFTQQSGKEATPSEWHYLNVFYKDSKKEYSHLKYKFMTSLYKGYHYDIVLLNNNNDRVCTQSLNNFARSLQFVDTKESKK